MHAGSATANAASERYAIFGEIASGGMATIHYGRAVGAAGFARAVAIKRLHPQFAKDPAFVSMFLDEARLASRIAHANVVPTLDVLSGPDELAVVMEYVHGESLARLMRTAADRGEGIPAPIAVTLLVGILHGLHAAHETTDDHDQPLHIVHRDVSPENVLVGGDGVPRLIDFGIARAEGRSRITPAGEVKGKLAYMAVEQYKGADVDRRVDVYGASVVLWEALTGRELFSGDSDAAVVNAVLERTVEPPSALRPELPAALDAIVMRGLSRERDARFATAREMALMLERHVGVVPQGKVSDWVAEEAGALLAQRATMLRRQQAPRAILAVEDGLAGTRVITNPPEPPEPPQPDAVVGGVGASSERRRSGLRTVAPPRRALTAVATLILVVAGIALYLARSRDVESTAAPSDAAPAQRAEPAPPPQTATPAAPVPSEGAPEVAAQPPAEAPAPVADPPAAQLEPAAKNADASLAAEQAAPARAEARPQPAPPHAERAPREKQRARATRPPKVDCSNPFVIDARGIRRARPECL